MKRSSRFVLTILLLLPAMTPARQAEAQGFIIPELGVRKNGMGAAVGRPDELAAIYHNPGALALLPGTQIEISAGFAFLGTHIRMAPWEGSDSFLTEPVGSDGYFPEESPSVVAPIPMIGASTNLWSDKLVGALAVYVPNAAGATFGEDAPSRYHIIDAYVFSAFFTAAVAYRPLPWLAVGLGGSAVYIRIHRRSLLYPVVDGMDVSGFVGKEAELEIDGEDVKPAFNLGIQVWPDKTLSLGFMMLTRYDVSLEGPLRLKPTKGSLFDMTEESRNELANNRQRTEIVSPWVFAFGANWDITPRIEVGAEFRYYLNSQVTEQVTTITSEGLLKDMMPNGFVTPKNLHNSFHTGGGFNIRPPLAFGLEVMTGVHYESSASPDKTVEVSAPSFDLFSLHIGVRWSIKQRYRISLLYAHYWYFERTTTDSITSPPTNFVGSGFSNMVTLVLEGQVARGIGVGK